MVAYARAADTGALTPLQTISTLPPAFSGADSTAESRLHPTGRFLYASNRGHDSFAAYAVNVDGTLRLLGITPCGDQHPRNLALSPDGAWLVRANRDSDNLVSFKVDPATGNTVTVPQAVCMHFAP